MKVLHVISDENIGGAGVLLTTLLRRFDRTRVESVVALPRESALRGRIEALGIPVRGLIHPCDRVQPESVRELRAILLEEDVELVHANAALAARVAGRLCRRHVVHTRHCCFPPQGIWRLPPVRAVGGVLNAHLSERVIATADAAAEDLGRLGVPRDRIEVIPNGSEPIRPLPPEELARARAHWGIGEADFVVGICARLVPCKGHETFLRAARALRDAIPERQCRFLIVGTGESEQLLRRRVRELGLDGEVIFTGFVEDMATVYRLLSVNVNCSSGTETSCLALSEGMSAALPTVASDYGGNRAMLGNGSAGFSFPVGDADALAQILISLARDPALCRRMQAAAYARYRSHYTAEQMTERVTQLYESLCGV